MCAAMLNKSLMRTAAKCPFAGWKKSSNRSSQGKMRWESVIGIEFPQELADRYNSLQNYCQTFKIHAVEYLSEGRDCNEG